MKWFDSEDSAVGFTFDRIFSPLRNQGTGLILPHHSRAFALQYCSNIIDCIPALVTHSELNSDGEIETRMG